MIYYYVKNRDNYLKDGWSQLPTLYSEINSDVQHFQFNKHFKPVYEIPQERFVVLLDLRHRLVAQHLMHYTIPEETHEAIKNNRCKILLFGWMENWSDNEFQQIFATLKRKHEWLEQKYFVYVSCSLEDFHNKEYTHIYANKMEWQWHECNYKKVERNSKDKRFQPAFKFICLNRRPSWHRFLTVSHMFDHRRDGMLTHLSPDSVYNDYQYGYKTAKRHYDDHYEVFRDMEVKSLPKYVEPAEALESDWTGIGHIEELGEEKFEDLIIRRSKYVYEKMKFAFDWIVTHDRTAHRKLHKLMWPKGKASKEHDNWSLDFPKKINEFFNGYGFHSDYQEQDHHHMVWYWKKESTGEIFRARTREEMTEMRNKHLTLPPPPKQKSEGVLAKRWKKMVEQNLPLLIKEDKHKIHNGDNPNKDVDSVKYLKAMIHVVTETTAEHNQDLFASEKTFKPMFYKRPFLIAGQKGLYKKLHTLGYKTFSNIFNENFDNTTNDWKRITEVCNEAVKWAKRTKEQCSDLFNETKDICDSNFKNLVERGKNAEKNLHDKILETF